MYFYPWSSSSFPISSETGRGLTSISLPGLTIATPPKKLWLLLAFFLLEIFCFTPTKTGLKPPATSICCTHHDHDFSVYRIQTIFRKPLDQSKKQGKYSSCSPAPQIPKSQVSAQHIISSTTLGTNCLKSECNTTVKGP